MIKTPDFSVSTEIDFSVNTNIDCSSCRSLIEQIHTLNAQLAESQNELSTNIEKLRELNAHLKKYTAPERNRTYYQVHKEELKQDPEYKQRRSEINKRAYEKRKRNKNIQDPSFV